MGKKIVIIGGVAGGATAAARALEIRAEVTIGWLATRTW